MNNKHYMAAMMAGLIAAPAMAARDFAAAPQVNPNQKGSLLVWSDVEVKYDENEDLIGDTILELTNDSNNGVYVQMYFINGDCPTEEIRSGTFPFELLERAHSGWNFVDVQIFLSPNKPTFWSAATGNNSSILNLLFGGGDSLQVPPFGNLDADPKAYDHPDHQGTGRPDPDNHLFDLNNRVVRGYIVGWAVEIGGSESQHNELSGSAMKIDYQLGAAWEYDAFSYKRLSSAAGDGILTMNGVEYDRSPARLQLDFFSVPTIVLNQGVAIGFYDTDLTMHPAEADFRAVGGGPVTTWVQADIWNQNEDRFSGAARCVTCWDQTLISDFMGHGVITANHFLRDNIGTDKGKARLTGKGGVACPNCLDPDGPAITATEQPILGVAAKIMIAGRGAELAGSNLTMHGTDDTATIRWDIVDPATELMEIEMETLQNNRDALGHSPAKINKANRGLGARN